MKMRTLLLTFIILLLLRLASQAATIVITVGDNYYSPKTVTAQPGDVITWHYQSGATSTHPTASDNGAWVTFTISPSNNDHSITFPTAGSFPYHCQYHGSPGTGMYGVITVAAALAAQPAQLAAALRAYPNPATDVLTLRFGPSAAGGGRQSVQLLNAMGGVVRTLDAGTVAAGQELTLSVADLPAGLYFYRLLVSQEVVANQRLLLVR